ncbi:MAG: hypothetical protein H7A23_27130 [Leptospiraceae bacterium]|nr:hypothetical protein [Leptospiraceae bacterium]
MKLLFAILLALLLSSCINYSGGKFFFNNGTCRDGEYMSKCGALLWVCLFGVSPTSENYSRFSFYCMWNQASCAANYNCGSY